MMDDAVNTTCARVAEQLELYVLDALAADEREAIRLHLQDCPDCRAQEADCRTLVQGIRRSSTPLEPRPLLRQQVRAAVGAEIRRQRRWGRLGAILKPAAVAAALLVAATLYLHAPQSHEALSRSDVQQLWQLDGAHTASAAADGVVISGERMYLLRQDSGVGRVACIDTTTGNQRWQSTVTSIGRICADGGRVYFLSQSPQSGVDLVALDATDGKLLWRSNRDEVASNVSQPSVVSDGSVCWVTGGVINLIDPSCGETRWSRNIADEGAISAGAASDNRLYVATARGVHCLDAANGAELWRQDCQGDYSLRLRPLLTICDDQIYVAQKSMTGMDEVFCMDAESHSVAWTHELPRVEHLLATAEALYVRGQDILAMDTASGETLWRQKATGCGPVTYSQGLVYFVDASNTGRLVGLNANTGGKIFELAGLHSCDAFNKVGNKGFIKTQDGVVHAMAIAR